MFEGFSQQTVDFMWSLRLNNNKVWFDANKDDFKNHFQAPMKALGQEVFARISGEYAKYGFIHKLSRIYKDARRVKGGEPYRDCLWFSIEKPVERDWTAIPVFWFELKPEEWSYGLGFYAAKAATMAQFRARIDKNPKEFERFVAPLGKQDEFKLTGEEYARKKQAPTEKTAEWYNRKSISLMHWQKIGDEIFKADLANRITDGFRFLMPYYDYFISIV